MDTTDWIGRLQRIDFSTACCFLAWYLGQKTHFNGKKKWEIKSRQTLVIFWCKFRMVFENHFHYKIDKRISKRSLNNVRLRTRLADCEKLEGTF